MRYFNKNLRKWFKSKESSNRAEKGIWSWRKNPNLFELNKKINQNIVILTLIIGILSYFGANKNLINTTIHFFMTSLLGLLTSYISEQLIIKCGFKWIEKIRWSINLGPFNGSISAFILAASFVEFCLF